MSDHINRVIDHRGLGLRSQFGVPLDGEQAFGEGFGFERNPWRQPGTCVPLRDQWSLEWQFAERQSSNAEGDAR